MARTWDSFQLKLYSDLAFRGDLIQDGHKMNEKFRNCSALMMYELAEFVANKYVIKV